MATAPPRRITNSTMISLLDVFLALGCVALVSAQKGTAYSTRYWDCCKATCSNGFLLANSPVTTCDVRDDFFTASALASTSPDGCNAGGGSAYMCTTLAPFGVSNDLAYGFAAVSITNFTDLDTCCTCYK